MAFGFGKGLFGQNGGSGSGAAIGGTVTGATATRVFFADTGGTLGDDADFTWDKTTNALNVKAKYLIDGQPTIDGSGSLDFTRFGKGQNNVYLSSYEGGTSGQVSIETQGIVRARFDNSTSTFFANSAARVPLSIQLAASQTADAFQVLASDGTTKIFHTTANGRVGVSDSPNGSQPSIFGATATTGIGFYLNTVSTNISGSYPQFFSTTEMRNASNIGLNWSSNTNPYDGISDTGLARLSAGVVKVTNGSSGGGSLLFQEMTAPNAPSANNVILFAEDNGSGKTRIVARFASGADVVLATEA